jgi:peptide/nickel transport system substrate-binding protein
LPIATTCHFYHESGDCDPNLEPLPYDPDQAAALLDEAGWVDSNGNGVRDKDGVEFEFVFMIPASSEGAALMATKMKEDFARVGVELNLQRVEWASFTGRLREHDFDACTLLWGGGARGDPTQIWHSDSIEGGSNYISFRNERVDEIIEEARATLDIDARQTLYREFGRILHEEQPYTWLYVRPRLSLIHHRVRGVRESLQYWQYRDWWVDQGDD